MKMIIDEDTGELKPFVTKAQKVSQDLKNVQFHGTDGYAAQAETAPVSKGSGKRASKNPPSTGSVRRGVAQVKRFIATYGCNLAFQAGRFMGEGPMGWVDVTGELLTRAHDHKEGNAHRDFLPMLQDFLAIPDVATSQHSAHYHERLVDAKGRITWRPLTLNKDQVMLTDGIYDIFTNVHEPFNGRVIYGPRVSMPWLTKEEDDEPARCAEFEEMVERALPDPEIRRHFQEVMSGLLQPHVLLRGQIIFWGPPASGKTTMATALGCSVAGGPGVSFIQEANLVRNKWCAAGLLNRFANISDDSPVVKGWSGFLKGYTSGNLFVEVKFGNPFRAPATAKLISTCNELQDAMDASGAMVDRMFPFHFGQRVRGEPNTDRMQVEYWCEPSRREGIVNWLLDGLIRLRERGRFDVPKTWEEEKQVAVSLADPLESWLRENLEKEEKGVVKLQELLTRLPAELTPNRSVEMRLAVYMSRLFDAAKMRKETDGEKTRIYMGVSWR